MSTENNPFGLAPLKREMTDDEIDAAIANPLAGVPVEMLLEAALERLSEAGASAIAASHVAEALRQVRKPRTRACGGPA